MNSGKRFFGSAILALLLLSASFQAGAAVRYTPAMLAERLQIAEGGIRLHGLRREGIGDTWLSLSPQPIFGPKAMLEIVGAGDTRKQAPPAVRHFHGYERDDPVALAFVSVHPDGRIRGWLRRGGQIEAFGREPGAEADVMTLVRVDLADVEGGRQFTCGSDHLPPIASLVPDRSLGQPASVPVPEGGDPDYWVNVAIDSDYEYYAQFNDTNAAASYAADLIGFASLLYRAEINTGLAIPYLRLFTTPDDPWQQTGTACMLYEFGAHWGQHQGQVQRTIAHFLSGKNLNSGIAWVGVLCRSNQNFDIGAQCPGLPAIGSYAGAYGVSTSLSGSFDPDNPQVAWDIVVVSHEIGHNFNSPHTHCYGGIGGNPSPIDQCFNSENGCYVGPTSLPGPMGQGTGTLMSYCHLLAGGLSNVSLNFGTGHPFGVQPIRVPSRMQAHVQERAAQAPACFVNFDLIYADGFECTDGSPGCGGSPGA